MIGLNFCLTNYTIQYKKLSCCWKAADASTAYITFWEKAFLLMFSYLCLQPFPSYSFSNVTGLAWNRPFSVPLFHLMPLMGWIPLGYSIHIWHRQTTVPRLWCGTGCMMSAVAILIQLALNFCLSNYTIQCVFNRGTGIRGLMRGMATLPQGNQELLVVKDKVGRPQVSLG